MMGTSGLRVASFNLCLLPKFTCLGLRNDEARVRAFMASFDWPDVLLLQEVWDTWLRCWSSVLEEGLRGKGYSHFVKDRPSPIYPVNSGLMIASRWPIHFSELQRFSQTCGLQRLVPRGFMCAAITLPACSLPILVVNTHLHAPTEDTSWFNSPETCRRVQRSQVLQMSNRISRLCGGEGGEGGNSFSFSLVMVGGDFNIDRLGGVTGGVTFKELSFIMGMDCVEFRSHTPPSTYPYPRNGQSSLVNPLFANRDCCLDHFFVRDLDDSLEVREDPNPNPNPVASIWIPVSRSSRSSRSSPPLWISDHAAVIVQCSLGR
jgi:hypothetical protein